MKKTKIQANSKISTSGTTVTVRKRLQNKTYKPKLMRKSSETNITRRIKRNLMSLIDDLSDQLSIWMNKF